MPSVDVKPAGGNVTRASWRLFAGCLIAIALLTKTDPDNAHEYSRFGTVESMVDRGTLQIDESSFIITVDKVVRDGHYYSHQLPLLAALETPVYWTLGLSGARFNNSGRRVITFAFTLLTNGVALALTIVIFAKILALAGVTRYRELTAVLLICGTWLLPYGVVSNNHGISGMLLAALIYLLLIAQWRTVSTTGAALIGGVLGLLVAIELLPLISFVPATLIYLATRRLPMRAWLALAAAMALPLLAHVILNYRITGDAIPAGFHTEMFNYPGTIFDPDSLTGSVKYHSVGEVGAYAWTVLFVGRGFLTFAPLRLVALVAGAIEWRWWARARGVQLVLLAGIASSFGAALLTTNNFGGIAVGFRHAVYLAPAFVTLLLPWIVDAPEWRRRAILTVASVSVALMLVFAVRSPWSLLLVNHARIGTWDEYVPILARLVNGDLLMP